ncbi:MAG: NADPH-dependent reductase [Ilumatobacteraceae bacterium]|nr:NADPH-dependent reductase [Ilumatobacteraceae bacterium]
MTPSLTDPLRLGIIIGSTREGRYADVVANWFIAHARRHGAFDVDVIDVAALDLPVHFTKADHPALDAYRERIDAAEAFVVVTPEYNHSYPASLKHAIDLANPEWKRKPLGFVSYGGISGGLRAVEHLRQVFAELHVATIRDTVSFQGPWQQFDADGNLVNPAMAEAAVATMLDDLRWWATALRAAKAADAAELEHAAW